MRLSVQKVQQVAEYVAQGMTDVQACKKAGYDVPKEAAYKLRADVRYQTILGELQAQNAEMSKLKRQDIQDIVMEAIDMARVGADPMTMIRGAQELNKMCGFYAPEEKKYSLNISQRRIQEQFDSLTDTELLELASRTEEIVIEDAEIIEIDDERPDDSR